MQILTGLKREPAAIAFSPAGRYLAAGERRAIHLWEPSAGTAPLWSAKHPITNNPSTFCFTADGQSVVRRFDLHTFHRHNVRTGKSETDAALTHLGPFLFSPDGLFAIGWKRTVGGEGVWCARADGFGNWAEVWQREFPYDKETGAGGYELLEFSPDSERVCRVCRRGAYQSITEMVAESFEATSGEPIGRWEGELPVNARNGAVGPSGTVVVLNGRHFYAVDTTGAGSKAVKRQNASAQHFTAAAFSPDGSRLATTSNDTAATIWDSALWEVRKRYEWNIGRLRTVCFAPDGLRCAAAGDTGQIVVWDLDD